MNGISDEPTLSTQWEGKQPELSPLTQILAAEKEKGWKKKAKMLKGLFK